MMEYNSAKEIRDYALSSIEHLSRALNFAQDKCSEEEFASIKRSIGLSIAKIDSDILGYLYQQYPQLDHIKK